MLTLFISDKCSVYFRHPQVLILFIWNTHTCWHCTSQTPTSADIVYLRHPHVLILFISDICVCCHCIFQAPICANSVHVCWDCLYQTPMCVDTIFQTPMHADIVLYISNTHDMVYFRQPHMLTLLISDTHTSWHCLFQTPTHPDMVYFKQPHVLILLFQTPTCADIVYFRHQRVLTLFISDTRACWHCYGASPRATCGSVVLRPTWQCCPTHLPPLSTLCQQHFDSTPFTVSTQQFKTICSISDHAQYITFQNRFILTITKQNFI